MRLRSVEEGRGSTGEAGFEVTGILGLCFEGCLDGYRTCTWGWRWGAGGQGCRI
jgi:hypothetical protein